MSASNVLQYCVFGVINGSAYGLMGVSFGLILGVTQRFHFSWAIDFAIGGFFSAWLVSVHGLPPLIAIIVALIGAMAFSVGTEAFIYRPVVARWGNNNLLAVFVASFGLTIAAVSLIELLVPVGNVTLNWISVAPVHLGSTQVTSLDLLYVPFMWICGVAVWAMLKYTALGRRVRAVRANPGMAETIGIDSRRTFLVVFAVGALLAGVTGVFYAMKYAGTPDMGLTPVFYAFVVAYLAGIGRSPVQTLVVGIGLGVVESLSALALSPVWEEVVVFGILLCMLLVKAGRVWRPNLFAIASTGRR